MKSIACLGLLDNRLMMRQPIVFLPVWTWTAAHILSVAICFSLHNYHASLIERLTVLPFRPRLAKEARRMIIQHQHCHRCCRLHSTIPQWDGDLSEEDQAIIQMIRGPFNVGKEIRKPRSILILSDTTGVTAKAAVEKAMAQFNGCDERFIGVFGKDEDGCENLTTRIVPFVRTDTEVAELLRHKTHDQTMVIFTFADPTLRQRASRMCELSNLKYVDLLGNMFDVLSDFLQRKPLGAFSLEAKNSKQRSLLSDDYFRRIDAVEFTLKCDDGCHPELMAEADVVLTGVSRTGKTPLSVYLAQTMGLRVSNVPLVVDLDPPKQLATVNPKRVFCLLLDLADLHKIRKARLQGELKGRAKNEYADKQYLRRDLRHARDLAVQYGFTEIDVSNRAVEETASFIRSLLKERFGE